MLPFPLGMAAFRKEMIIMIFMRCASVCISLVNLPRLEKAVKTEAGNHLVVPGLSMVWKHFGEWIRSRL
jgi:hypothetical protein